MSDPQLNVLLVEDSEMVAELVTIWLTECEDPKLAVQRVTRLDQALETLGTGTFDAMLLDLSLPDSTGLDTVRRTVAHSPDVPVVVLTASSDPDLALGAVKAGAQDYLFKMHMNGESLQRALVYAIERHKRAAGSEPRERGWVDHEIERVQELSRISWPSGEGDEGVLTHSSPEAFEQLSQLYTAMLGDLVDAHASGVTPEDPTDRLRAISEALMDEFGGPADVVALHVKALRTGLSQGQVDHLKANPHITRGLGLKFMGHLVAAYRSAALTRRSGRRRRTLTH